MYEQGSADALETFALREKRAILGSLALGLGLHTGANALMKAFRGSHAGHRFQAGQMADAFQHGVTRRQVNPVARNVATYGVGPESMVSYDLGHSLGTNMAELSKGQRYRQLKKLRKAVAMSPELNAAPMTNEIVPAVNRILSGQRGLMGRLPTVPVGQKATLGQRALSAGLAGAAIAAEPHTAIHMGINAARDFTGRSEFGKRFMREGAQKGFEKGNLPRGSEAAVDLAVSPAALDTRRLGAAAQRAYQQDPRALRRVMGTGLGNALQIPSVRQQLSARVPALMETLQSNPALMETLQSNPALGDALSAFKLR